MGKCCKCGMEFEDDQLFKSKEGEDLHCNGCLPKKRRPRKPKAPTFMVEIPPVSIVTAPEPVISLDQIRVSAEKVAVECGFVPPFQVNGPTRVEYPQHGHGYAVTLTELQAQPGKRERMGTAQFQADGQLSMWTQDGVLGGA